MTTQVQIAASPFSEGAFRYAFQGHDKMLDEQLVLKIPKQIYLNEYNIESMKEDLEITSICNLIVGQFNDRVIDKVSQPDLLRDFVRTFIYEILDPNASLKYYFAENYIKGDYQKQNNNGGWTANSFTEDAQLAQALSHFSWQLTRGYLIIVDI
jgi:vacuole morphology and inheritance protein 14